VTRRLRQSIESPRVGQDVQRQDSKPNPAKSQPDFRSRDGRATPETKATEILLLERTRQRTAIGRMNAIHEEVAMVTNALAELLSDPAFVALLRAQGFISIPRIIHQRLMEPC
jgi:hypothetical protein